MKLTRHLPEHVLDYTPLSAQRSTKSSRSEAEVSNPRTDSYSNPENTLVDARFGVAEDKMREPFAHPPYLGVASWRVARRQVETTEGGAGQ
ncbi:hypothetical protein HZH68_001625 [Vespula germanica]|uniref:Uncharacterized protein n=1 Tax=Vespula germanica TaxID=30212 RepID=A0A834NVV4_VESGE|nr:hypothetical protein HZH68_001625 [Vespula germanica]